MTALLVIPGLIGVFSASRLRSVLAWSVGSGVFGMLLGLLLVIWLGYFSSGAVIVLVLGALLGCAALRRRWAARRERSAGKSVFGGSS